MSLTTTTHTKLPTNTKLICCQRSGVPLIEVTSLCSSGWALLSQPVMGTLVHPVYGMPFGKQLRKLELQLIDADQAEWQLPPTLITEIALSISAIMYSLDAMWLPTEVGLTAGRNIEASLPDVKTTVGTASRVLELASWYFAETSQRITFPLWKPSKSAGNLNWHGFSGWLDACADIREEWATVRRKHASAEELMQATLDTNKLVSQAQVYKRIDVNKVWNWIELQASEHSHTYPLGRRATLKSLFMSGEQNPDMWLADDCDDLIELVINTCDIGNDITSYIRNRVNNVRAAINDFYSDFTLIGAGSKLGSDGGLTLSDSEKAAESKLFGSYELQLLDMTSAPVKPDPANYPNRVAALKAAAEFNILSKLFAAKSARLAASGKSNSSVSSTAGDL